MLNQLNLWNKIGRIVMLLSKQLDVSMPRALDIFYTSKTCANLHDPQTGLYLLSDQYIAENVIRDLKQNA